MRIPELTPLVFIGRSLAENDMDALYFQDAASYLDGIRFGDGNEGGEYYTVDAETHSCTTSSARWINFFTAR